MSILIWPVQSEYVNFHSLYFRSEAVMSLGNFVQPQCTNRVAATYMMHYTCHGLYWDLCLMRITNPILKSNCRGVVGIFIVCKWVSVVNPT